MDTSLYFEFPEKFYFDSGNSYTACKGDFNVKIVPDGEKFYKVYVWYGMFMQEKSEIAAQTEYDTNDKGYSDMLEWIDRQYVKFESENKKRKDA